MFRFSSVCRLFNCLQKIRLRKQQPDQNVRIKITKLNIETTITPLTEMLERARSFITRFRSIRTCYTYSLVRSQLSGIYVCYSNIFFRPYVIKLHPLKKDNFSISSFRIPDYKTMFNRDSTKYISQLNLHEKVVHTLP